MNWKRFHAATTLLVALGATPAARASVPPTLAQQGRLFDSAGSPLSGPTTLVFSFYAGPVGGAPLWTETLSVSLDQGYFSTPLGAVTPFPPDLWDGSTRYLALAVNGDPEMSPRQPVSSAPYALLAGDVHGDIHPSSVAINGSTVIDASGHWVGSPSGLVGPAGATGPAGPQGDAGPQGAAGAQGLQGVPGPAGPAGADGAMGPAGPAGPTGLPGDVGPAGPMGPAGPPGDIGPAGAPGESVFGESLSPGDPVCPDGGARFTIQGQSSYACNGAPGALGAMGPAGMPGEPVVAESLAPGDSVCPDGGARFSVSGADSYACNGAPGDPGAVGPTGPQGPEGAVGPMGPQGPTGADGAQGPTGPQGAQGAQGPTGPQGAQGAQGPTGPQGVQGAQGPTGPQGLQGAQGPTGPMGPTGATGAVGPQGATGAAGASPFTLVGSDAVYLSGSIGIGTSTPAALLDVAGAVRLGSATTCAAAQSGALRWTGTSLDVCTGSAWQTLAVSGPRTCQEVKAQNPAAGNGLYTVYPGSVAPFVVYCDMTTDGVQSALAAMIPSGGQTGGVAGNGTPTPATPDRKLSDAQIVALAMASTSLNPYRLTCGAGADVLTRYFRRTCTFGHDTISTGDCRGGASTSASTDYAGDPAAEAMYGLSANFSGSNPLKVAYRYVGSPRCLGPNDATFFSNTGTLYIR